MFVYIKWHTISAEFYILSDVDSYDAIVTNMSPKTSKYSANIKSLMQSMSKKIGVSF